VGILEPAEWLLARLRAELLVTEMDEAARLCVGRPAGAASILKLALERRVGEGGATPADDTCRPTTREGRGVTNHSLFSFLCVSCLHTGKTGGKKDEHAAFGS